MNISVLLVESHMGILLVYMSHSFLVIVGLNLIYHHIPHIFPLPCWHGWQMQVTYAQKRKALELLKQRIAVLEERDDG